MLSDGFVEALWETMIALAMGAGICVSVIGLAAHLNETRAVRSAGDAPVAARASMSGVTGVNVAPNLN
jgi:ABC-type nickel/cobalt efflux system permease component RcnA